LFHSVRLASPKTRVFADYLIERWHRLDPFGSRSPRSSHGPAVSTGRTKRS
jgi:hypothetical protein